MLCENKVKECLFNMKVLNRNFCIYMGTPVVIQTDLALPIHKKILN